MVAATEKEAAATEQIRSLADATPAVAEIGDNGNRDGPRSGDRSGQRNLKKAEKLAEKTDEATAAKTDVKVQLVDYSTQLMGERTALVDRLKLVLDKFEAKGGDGKPYRLYIASIGGIKIDVSDRAATLASISSWLSSDEGGLRLARNVGTFFACIIGSIIVAEIVRMILRRVMDGDHVTSNLLRDFIISYTGRVIVAIGFLLALSALEVNLDALLAVIGARAGRSIKIGDPVGNPKPPPVRPAGLPEIVDGERAGQAVFPRDREQGGPEVAPPGDRHSRFAGPPPRKQDIRLGISPHARDDGGGQRRQRENMLATGLSHRSRDGHERHGDPASRH